jgi:3'5'-cyclic nucleotide phosphodiesterase
VAQRKRINGIDANSSSVSYHPHSDSTCLDEVKETITIADYTNSTEEELLIDENENNIVSEQTLDDLRCYVKLIATMYRDNPFHNFEHACHVTMSVDKLLKRIISGDFIDDQNDPNDLLNEPSDRNRAIRVHNYTHGLCSDHVASFAIVFSALIHDVDHRGCSNMQLIQEEASLGIKYRSKSVAEQNSIDISWNLLMDGRFEALRHAIFGNQCELLRFRQFIVNAVLATDIFDKELNDLRKQRWVRAFSDDATTHDSDHSNRKATIVIEHIIQASDVSHTMQHWQVYRKWNKSLFHEMSLAYHQGRMKVDPATFWYQGELGFFDNYVIPLANKLKECNVFGVSSDEYLNYAINNRAEWDSRGQDIVAEMTQEFRRALDEEHSRTEE